MHQLLSLFTTSPEASVCLILILLSAGVAYARWFYPAKKAVIHELGFLVKIIEENGPNWESVKQHAKRNLQIGSRVTDIWKETEGRAIKLSVGRCEEYVMYGTPRDLWNPTALLARKLNLGLAEAIPNILVGVGLFFTFVFLSWALVGTTTALTEASSSKETEAAISQLLRIAGGKFLTSLAGLGASIIWTVLYRRSLTKLQLPAINCWQRWLGLLSPQVVKS